MGTGYYRIYTNANNLVGCAPVATVGVAAAGRPNTAQAYLAIGADRYSLLVRTNDATTQAVDVPFDVIITCPGASPIRLYPTSYGIEQPEVPNADQCAFTSSFVEFQPGAQPTYQGFVSTWATSSETALLLLKNGGYGIRYGFGADIVATC